MSTHQYPSRSSPLCAVGSTRPGTGRLCKCGNNQQKNRLWAYRNSIAGQLTMKLSTVLFAAVMVELSLAGEGRASTIDFEGFADGTILTTQYPGLTFSNAIILTSGISLNEFDFPPHSGVNVASDNNGPITIDFSTPITSFSGYFTYIEPLTLDGFAAADTGVADAASVFSDNDALFGDPGSSPNELIGISDAGGMSSVTITGDPLGGSFTVDDISYTADTPEPEMRWVPLIAFIALASMRKRLLNKPPQ
jgi:hypothetical protein